MPEATYSNELLTQQALENEERLNNLSKNASNTETVDRTIYVRITGNDNYGNGSLTKPFLTVLRALSDIKKYINDVNITIDIGAGNYEFNNGAIEQALSDIQILGSGKIQFQGTPVLVKDNFTLDASTTPYIYGVTDPSGAWIANEYRDMFIKVGTAYHQITSNTTNTLNSFAGKAAATEIYEMQTVFGLHDNDFNITLKHPNLNAQVKFSYVTIDASSHLLNIAVSNADTRITNSNITALGTQIDRQSLFLAFTNVGIVVSTNHGVEDGAPAQSTTYNGVSIRKSGAKSQYGIYVSNDRTFKDVYVENFAYGAYLSWGNYFGNQDSTEFIIKDCTYGFNIRNNTQISYPVNILYVDNVDYLLASSETIGFGTKVYLPNYIQVTEASTFAPSVTIQETDVSINIYYIIT